MVLFLLKILTHFAPKVLSCKIALLLQTMLKFQISRDGQKPFSTSPRVHRNANYLLEKGKLLPAGYTTWVGLTTGNKWEEGPTASQKGQKEGGGVCVHADLEPRASQKHWKEGRNLVSYTLKNKYKQHRSEGIFQLPTQKEVNLNLS